MCNSSNIILCGQNGIAVCRFTPIGGAIWDSSVTCEKVCNDVISHKNHIILLKILTGVMYMYNGVKQIIVLISIRFLIRLSTNHAIMPHLTYITRFHCEDTSAKLQRIHMWLTEWKCHHTLFSTNCSMFIKETIWSEGSWILPNNRVHMCAVKIDDHLKQSTRWCTSTAKQSL